MATTRKQLCKILQAATGLDEFVIWRTADALGETGLIPPNDRSDALPEDAARLLFAAAASRSPSEAAEVLQAHISAPLCWASATINGAPHDLTREELDKLAEISGVPAAASAPEWFCHFLTPRDERSDAVGVVKVDCRAAIGCGMDAVFSSLRLRIYLASGELWVLSLMFCGPGAEKRCDFASVRKIGNSVFAALTAELCGSGSLYRMEGAALTAVVN